jgi:hypothetical protein
MATAVTSGEGGSQLESISLEAAGSLVHDRFSREALGPISIPLRLTLLYERHRSATAYGANNAVYGVIGITSLVSVRSFVPTLRTSVSCRCGALGQLMRAPPMAPRPTAVEH